MIDHQLLAGAYPERRDSDFWGWVILTGIIIVIGAGCATLACGAHIQPITATGAQ